MIPPEADVPDPQADTPVPDADAPVTVASVPTSALHPVATPCLRVHCLYDDMEQRMITDLSYRKRLADLEYEVTALRRDRNLLRAMRFQLQALTSDLMSGPPQRTRKEILAQLTTIGL